MSVNMRRVLVLSQRGRDCHTPQRPFRVWRTNLGTTHHTLLPSPSPFYQSHLQLFSMSKTKAQDVAQSPAKWQLASWSKKDEQFARIPHEWRLTSLPTPDVTSFVGIPRTCGLLSKEELDITENYDATALAAAIRSRKLTCVDVTRAFCKVFN